MKIALIVAVSENGVIGKNNDLIWHLPNDIQFFKEKTLNHHVIMGRKNFESIPHKYRPLPKRTNIIITKQTNYTAKDCFVVNSISAALKIAAKNQDLEPFIIGGGQIYELALQKNLVDKIYLTKIHHYFKGDTFFSDLDTNKWKEIAKDHHKADDKHDYDYTFFTFEKIN